MSPSADTPSPGSHAENPKNVVNSVAKAFSVLQAFSPARQALTITEIADSADLDRGTSFRLVHTLVALGYLRPVAVRRFRLTVKCMELGFVALTTQEAWSEAQPLLDDCVPALCDAASVGVLDGADVVFIARAEQGLDRHRIDRRPGRRIRAYGSALGHALLAHLPRERQIEVLDSAERVPLSEKTLTNLEALLQRLADVRSQGYAVSDGENAFGLRTLAVPILGPDGAPLAAVSFTVDTQRMAIDALVASTLPRARVIAAELQRAAAIRSVSKLMT